MTDWFRQSAIAARGSKRFRPPTSSRQPAVNRACLVDVAWVCLSAWLTLILRDQAYLQADRLPFVAQYIALTGGIGAVIFLGMRSGATLSVCFSTRDMLKLAKGAVATIALSALLISSWTKLDGLPRSVFFIHILILIAGLVAWRLAYRSTLGSGSTPGPVRPSDQRENILLVGANRLGLLYSQMIDDFQNRHSQIVGFLDDRPRVCGRRLNGHPVVGLISDVRRIVAEYETHGIEIDRIVFAGGPGDFASEVVGSLRTYTAERSMALDFLSDILSFAPEARGQRQPAFSPAAAVPGHADFPRAARTSPALYWRAKRAVDVVVAGCLIVVTAPVMALVALFTIFDLGAPALFWQQRIGQNGTRFLIYKFRTLRPPLDGEGQLLGSEDRISAAGSIIRFARLDELPQLFNVLLGEMSLIGPRPLLPVDQPADSTARLTVRPGITGWAQVHGGRTLSAESKAALDEWYCTNAGFAIDLKIVLKTAKTVFFGEGAEDHAARCALDLAQSTRTRAAA